MADEIAYDFGDIWETGHPKDVLNGLERGDFPDRDWPPGTTAREAIQILAARYRGGEPVRPVVGQTKPNGKTGLLVGQLRFAACMAAGITDIPAYVISATIAPATLKVLLAKLRAAEVLIPDDLPPQDGQHRSRS